MPTICPVHICIWQHHNRLKHFKLVLSRRQKWVFFIYVFNQHSMLPTDLVFCLPYYCNIGTWFFFFFYLNIDKCIFLLNVDESISWPVIVLLMEFDHPGPMVCWISKMNLLLFSNCHLILMLQHIKICKFLFLYLLFLGKIRVVKGCHGDPNFILCRFHCSLCSDYVLQRLNMCLPIAL